MRKLLLAASLTGIASGAFAQGTVFFDDNSNLQPFICVGNISTYAPAGQFDVALYWVNQSSGAFTPINPAMATAVVTFTGDSTGSFDDGKPVIIPGQTAGGVGEFVVAGWLGTQYSTYAGALAAGTPVGFSSPFYNSTGGNGSPAAVAQQLSGWTGEGLILKVSPTPEPSTIALGGLGAVALLFFRRRQ